MTGYELRVQPAPPQLAELFPGSTVELRELDYGAISAIRNAGELRTETMLAQCLYVDGEPLGIEALNALPGRFATVINGALMIVAQLHDIGPPASDAEDVDPKP